MRHNKKSIVILIVVCLLVGVCLSSSSENTDSIAYEKKPNEIEIEAGNENNSDTEIVEYNSLEDYINIIGEGKIARFVEPIYIIECNGTIKSEENAVYFEDKQGNECLVSIQYDIDSKRSDRTVIYRIRYDKEDDDRAKKELCKIGEYIKYLDIDKDIAEVYDNTVKEYSIQMFISGKTIVYENCSAEVVVRKALEEDKVGYTLSVKTSWDSDMQIQDSILDLRSLYKSIINGESEQCNLMCALEESARDKTQRLRVIIGTDGVSGVGCNLAVNGVDIELNARKNTNDGRVIEFTNITNMIGNNQRIDWFRGIVQGSGIELGKYLKELDDVMAERVSEVKIQSLNSTIRVIEVENEKVFEIEKQ